MSDDFWSILGASSTSSYTSAINTTNASNTSTSSSTSGTDGLGKDAFMKLLLTQMQSQDPLSPMDGQDFFAQLAQFSLLEQVWKMNDNLTSMQQQQQLLQASNLIGRTVGYTDDNGAIQSGLVKGIKVIGGTVYADVEGKQVALSKVQTIEE